MEIIAYTVAPLIHYAPFYTALAALKKQTGCSVTFPHCNTDDEVIAGASEADLSNEQRIVLALTSTTDSARNDGFSKAASILGVLTPLIPRPPLWFVCSNKRRKEVCRILKSLSSGKTPARKLNLACYPEGTTSHWVVVNSFPEGSVSFDHSLSFQKDRVTSARFKKGRCDLAVTLHPWRYGKAINDDLALVAGPPVAPFGFTTVLFQKWAIENSDLREQLRAVRELIHNEITALYLCFELSGFDWRRHSPQVAPRPPTKQDFILKLNESLKELGIETENCFAKTDVSEGLRHLAEARIWMLPESALEAMAGDSGTLESFRTIRERWADEHGELERLENERAATTKLVKRLYEDTKPILDTLAENYLETDPWRRGQQHFDRLSVQIRDRVFSTTGAHWPPHHKDAQVLKEAIAQTLESDIGELCRALKAQHHFPEQITTSMFRLWMDSSQIDLQLQEARYGQDWSGPQNAVGSICLAFTLREKNLPAIWVHEVLKASPNGCAFSGLDDNGLKETLLPLAQIEIPKKGKEPSQTSGILQGLLALCTLGNELKAIKAAYHGVLLGKALKITGRLQANGKDGVAGLSGLEERLNTITKEGKNPLSPIGTSLQGLTRSFWALHKAGARLAWERPGETNAIDFNITFDLHPCHEAYVL